MRTITKIALTACVVVGGGGFMVYSSIAHASHYRLVNELVTDGFERWQGRDLTVHGLVKPGSLVEAITDQVTERSFVLQMNGSEIRVFSRGPKPDTFTDLADVLAMGRVVPATTLQARADALCRRPIAGCPVRANAEQPWAVDADELSAKCPSHYDGARSNQKLGEPTTR